MFEQLTVNEYLEKLASSEPVPGGGGASAIAAALGTALASMVANLTIGKEKYAEYQPEINKVIQEACQVREELLQLSNQDAEVFYPLSQAYGIPKDNPDREEVLEDALKLAADIPLKIMLKIIDALKLHERLLGHSSKLAVSDIGTGASIAKGALQGAFLNVAVNTKLMKNREYASEINIKAREILDSGCSLADKIYGDVEKQLWT